MLDSPLIVIRLGCAFSLQRLLLGPGLRVCILFTKVIYFNLQHHFCFSLLQSCLFCFKNAHAYLITVPLKIDRLTDTDTDTDRHWQTLTLTPTDTDTARNCQILHWQTLTDKDTDTDRHWYWKTLTLTDTDNDWHRDWHWQRHQQKLTDTDTDKHLQTTKLTLTDIDIDRHRHWYWYWQTRMLTLTVTDSHWQTQILTRPAISHLPSMKSIQTPVEMVETAQPGTGAFAQNHMG